MTDGKTDLQNAYFESLSDHGSCTREICANGFVEVVVGELLTCEPEFHVQALWNFVTPPETTHVL